MLYNTLRIGDLRRLFRVFHFGVAGLWKSCNNARRRIVAVKRMFRSHPRESLELDATSSLFL